jgi:hypothetical protein
MSSEPIGNLRIGHSLAGGGSNMSDLDVFLGVWRTEGTILPANGGLPEHLVASDVYEWFAGDKFMLHHVNGTMGANPVQALEIIRQDDGGNLLSHAIDNKGQYGEYKLRLDGRSWTILGTSERFEGTFNADFTVLEGQWFAVSDTGSEKPWMHIRLSRPEASPVGTQ